jgi:thymidylate synthase (FAD)
MKVTYIDHMGSDLSVVNAARVSFAKKSKGLECTDIVVGKYELRPEDKSLIQFLARGCTSKEWAEVKDTIGYKWTKETCRGNKNVEELLRYIKNMPTHWTPFGHTAITLHIKAPIFVARQLGKHQVGMVWNEVSRRYVDDEPEFYVPDVWRGRSVDKKQGSDGVALTYVQDWDTYNLSLKIYSELLGDGVCPEQARMVLPQSMYTEWYWTGNLYSFANVFIQRTDAHAQKETQEVARQIGEIIEPLFPESWKALTQ